MSWETAEDALFPGGRIDEFVLVLKRYDLFKDEDLVLRLCSLAFHLRSSQRLRRGSYKELTTAQFALRYVNSP